MTMVYAYKNNESELQRSSSGGAFKAICEIFEREHNSSKVAFYGATFNSELSVEHRCVFRAIDCHIFQGSKYVKSKISGIYDDVIGKLESGYCILFSGLPCQIFGLKKHIENKQVDSTRLFTIDIICHGAPQDGIWQSYKKWIESKANSKMIKYSFRYKPEGWRAYPAFAQFESGGIFVNTPETSVYSKLYMECYSIAKGCFSCPFSCRERQGDITLGDYWGIEKIQPEFPSKGGVSLILSHTEKASQLIDALIECVKSNKGECLLRTEGKEYLRYQHNLNKPSHKPEVYDVFWSDYKAYGFNYVVSKYLRYGYKYRILYYFKKIVRKTRLIVWYRNIKHSIRQTQDD